MNIELLKISLESENNIQGTSSWLRGFFATKFNEYNILHNHNTDRFIYGYPLVQYKMIKNIPIIIGINEGSEILKKICGEIHTIKLGINDYNISKLDILLSKEEFGISDKLYTYDFLVPWWALSTKNYSKYSLINNYDERKEILRKILIGNIISMSKSLNYTIPEKIKCEVDLKERIGKFKKNNILLFSGRFYTNFIIPDFMGVGKSVSHGYGTVISLKNIKSR